MLAVPLAVRSSVAVAVTAAEGATPMRATPVRGGAAAARHVSENHVHGCRVLLRTQVAIGARFAQMKQGRIDRMRPFGRVRPVMPNAGAGA